MILVTGATGQLGQLVIENLLKTVPAQNIIAAVRNPEKATSLKTLGVHVRKADYNQPDQWPRALDGVEKILLISSSEVGSRVHQHRAVIQAAKNQGKIKLIAYTSILHADRSKMILAQEHQATEKMIQESGLNFTILRNGWYTENYTMSIPSALEHGAIFGAANKGRISSATRNDYAEAAAKVLTIAIPEKFYELAGDTSYTLEDLAAQISKISGKTVRYNNLSEESYKVFLTKVGLPEGFAGILAQSDACAAEGALFDESHQLNRLIGRKTTTMEELVVKLLKK